MDANFQVVGHGKNFCPNRVANTSEHQPTRRNGGSIEGLHDMKQRQFTWLSAMPAPTDAPSQLLAMCTNEADAIQVALRACAGRRRSQSQLAAQMGISKSYLSEIKAGDKPMPEWMVRPFASLTGSNIVQQYRDLQEALRIVSQKPTQSDRINRMARLLEQAA
jgi:hypothetical protein